MIRRIIQIDEEKCNGCAACALACHEGAISMVNGKAHLMRDDYCDGLGDCLPKCPTGAITFIEREALAYDEKAVMENKAAKKKATPCACAGTAVKSISESERASSELMQWPVQIKLLPTKAPFFKDSNILIAADCTAYAYADFHKDFIKGRITLIGCPKLDNTDYTEKLSEIFSENNVESVLLARMQVPCCGGLEHAIKRAIEISGKDIPLRIVTLTSNGQIL